MPEALPPGSIIGILGGGQLGRMLSLAAARLGLETHIYSDEPDVPAFDMSAFSTVGSFADEDDEQSLRDELTHVQLPAILKTRRFGYDGKGQALVRNGAEALAALTELRGQPALIERLVAFEREISVLVVRGEDGTLKFYDPVENVHQNGILAVSRVPARIHADCAEEARRIAGTVAEALGHVGVLCVEMFQREEAPRLLVNEIAPRVHNSGHWTIDACLVSQFENHIRAIAGWPLGETARHSDAVMTNLIGADVERWRELAAEEGVAVHLYGKAEARPGRKMGHTTRLLPKSS